MMDHNKTKTQYPEAPEYRSFRADPTEKETRKSRRWGLLLFLIPFALITLMLVTYLRIAASIPDVGQLHESASQFETTRILDRNGNLLYEIIPPDSGRREYISIDEVSPYLIAATIAVEDKDFYSHPGFDLKAMFRAFFQNAESHATVSGASTITQQLARNLLMSPEERYERSIRRKVREIVLAAEIERRYAKDEILELYLNENYYGSYAYGVEAAARTYFGISAHDLDFAQAAFLAGLPQAPGYYDIVNNREATLERFRTVLLLTYEQSRQKGCIPIHHKRDRVCIDPVMVNNAIEEIESFRFSPASFDMKYPHWVHYIYRLLEEKLGPDGLYRSGYTVITTLDPAIQDAAQEAVITQVTAAADRNVHNAALIALVPQTGDILAMVGSPDFDDQEHSGEINMTLTPRQPGSSIKPLVYAAAFEKGWTPATMIWDVETEFSPTGKPDGLLYGQPYKPTNYDNSFHGPILLRDALASSLNIPAVRALEFVGLYDDPATEMIEGFLPFAKRFHIDSLDRAGLGLSVALGGGEVTLLEMAAAYAVFANRGAYVAPRAILEVRDHTGSVLYSAEEPLKENVLNADYAWQISSILSDSSARSLGFGTGSVLDLSFPAAVKTGTTNDYRDNWTVGYTDALAVAVWAGNADNKPMDHSTGLTGAAPIWAQVMETAARIYPDVRGSGFPKPDSIRDEYICSDSGVEANPMCKAYRPESFAYYQMPAKASEGLWVTMQIDPWTGKKADMNCAAYAEEKTVLNVKDPWALRWLFETAQGQSWLQQYPDFTKDGIYPAPEESCAAYNVHPTVELYALYNGMVIEDESFEISGTVFLPPGGTDRIAYYELQYGPGDSPTEWRPIGGPQQREVRGTERLGVWETGPLPEGIYTIRLIVYGEQGRSVERRCIVNLTHPSYEFEPVRIYPEIYPDEDPFGVEDDVENFDESGIEFEEYIG